MMGLSNVITQNTRLSAALFPPPSSLENASIASTTRSVTSPLGASV